MRLLSMLLALFILGGCSNRIETEQVNEPAGLASYTLKLPQFRWQTRTSAHFRTHYLSGSLAELQIDSLLVANEIILTGQLAMLREEQYDKRIDLFYFNSREQIEEVVGRPFRALADAENMTVLAVRNDQQVARDAHEIMHVVSFDLWGGWDSRDSLAWLSEGLATYAGGVCNGYDVTELAAYLLQNTTDTVSLDSLIADFRAYPEMIGYILMESFVRYIIDTYGIDSIKDLWQRDDAAFEQILGKNITTIERQWHEYVRKAYPNPEVDDWDELKTGGCR